MLAGGQRLWPKESSPVGDAGWIIGVLNTNSSLNAVLCALLEIIILRVATSVLEIKP